MLVKQLSHSTHLHQCDPHAMPLGDASGVHTENSTIDWQFMNRKENQCNVAIFYTRPLAIHLHYFLLCHYSIPPPARRFYTMRLPCTITPTVPSYPCAVSAASTGCKFCGFPIMYPAPAFHRRDIYPLKYADSWNAARKGRYPRCGDE